MHKIILSLIVFFGSFLSGIHICSAATWVKLNENTTSKLMIDKQSILQKDQLKRAWVKIEFKIPQKNMDTPDKEYDLSKLLWYFDCDAQKAATSQVFQYLNAQLVYSAGIDIKNAEFIEPVPETDFDRAMRYTCNTGKPVKADPAKPAPGSTNSAAKTVANSEKSDTAAPVIEEKLDTKNEDTESKPKKNSNTAQSEHDWTYEGKTGPAAWGKLKPEFVTCNTGKNQSPINVDGTVDAKLNVLKVLQKFPAKDIVNNGHAIQVNFRDGNNLVLDNNVFKLKQLNFHSPSENTIKGKSYPLEAHFVHADKDGNVAVIGVMFNEGQENAGLTKLWKQMPTTIDKPQKLKSRLLPNELMPKNLDYYRFSGSLTTPPCSEGVRWLLIKSAVTASKEQIEALEKVIKHHNNRPVQPLNGRMIVE